MANKTLIPVLVTLMLLTGVCNTLLTKYQDLQCVRNCDSPNADERVYFEQPVLQTAQMFIGEMGCWLVVGCAALYRRAVSKSKGYTPIAEQGTQDGGEDDGNNASAETNPALKPLVAKDDGDRIPLEGWSTLLLALPSCCDITGTTLMNVGLLFVAASIYQMTRGALVLFVGLFSVIFLKRHLRAYQWFSLLVVVLGVALVGLAGAIQSDPQAKPVLGGGDDATTTVAEEARLVLRAISELSPDALQTVLGVLMIAGAQIFTATQFVLEEFILEKYSIEPIKMVGWEGLFGFGATLLGMVILHFSIGITPEGANGYFDAREGWYEMTHFPRIAVSSLLIMISIGGFNFFGLSVTRSVSATSRSTIDTCRTLFIWIVSLALRWETFKSLQILGFALLVYGTFLFNDIVALPGCGSGGRRQRDRAAPLLAEDPIEHS